WAAGRVHLLLLPLAILMLCVLFRSYNVALKIAISSLLMVIIAVVTLSFVGQDFMFKNLTERMEIDANNLSTLANIESGQKADVGQESVLAKDIIGRLGSDRGSLWLKGYELWEQKPVLGNGADGYYLAKNGSEGTHPHNWIVLLLVQYGLIGFICFTFLVKSILSVAVTSYLATKNGLAVLVIVYNTVFLLYGLLSGCFYYTLPLMFFAIVNGLFLGSYYNKKADRGGNEVL
ncbi:MAG: O-antigen ligase, partial [Oceanospirillaceae bacterium]